MQCESKIRRIPLFVKLLYTLFVTTQATYVTQMYGGTSLLWFCDAALLLTAAGLWMEKPLLLSAAAVGCLVTQTLWITDFICHLCGTGFVMDMVGYMFDSDTPVAMKALSMFHAWYPFFIVWMLCRLGYDRRAFITWTGVAWGLLIVCYCFTPAPPAPESDPEIQVNINMVFGLGFESPQTMMHPLAWLALMMMACPILFYLPAHLVLRWTVRPPVTANVPLAAAQPAPQTALDIDDPIAEASPGHAARRTEWRTTQRSAAPHVRQLG